jgi:hypothetical protein
VFFCKFSCFANNIPERFAVLFFASPLTGYGKVTYSSKYWAKLRIALGYQKVHQVTKGT